VLLAGNAGEVRFAIIASAITGRIPLNTRRSRPPTAMDHARRATRLLSVERPGPIGG
jgi:hypothetical protein